MESQGKFYVIEGLDASGKTTVINELKKIISKQNNNQLFFFTREPGGTLISEQIRKIILAKENSEMFEETEALLYAASRAQHINEIIIPKLLENKIVISDRFIDSSIAYQGIGRNIGIDRIKEINNFHNLPKVEMTFFIDITVEEIIKRTNARKGFELDRLDLENQTFFKKVSEAYNALIKEKKYFVIDGMQDSKKIANQIFTIINNE